MHFGGCSRATGASAYQWLIASLDCLDCALGLWVAGLQGGGKGVPRQMRLKTCPAARHYQLSLAWSNTRRRS